MIHCGDCLDILPTLPQVDAVVTSPPYGMPLDRVLRALRRVLVPSGTCWVLLDDAPVALVRSYTDDEWSLGSVTEVGHHERLYCLHVTAQPPPPRYVAHAPDERVVCDIYAPMSAALVTYCVTTSTRVGDLVLDPFCGIGTTGRVCAALERSFIGVEIDPMRVALAATYIARHK